jgi:membrane fusion protein (multidrug efflux system)
MEGDVLTNAIIIPQKSVMITQQGSLVMALDKDNVVVPMPVVVSETIGNSYLVDSGLKGGERIVSEGLVKARPGAKVSIMPSMEEMQKAEQDKKAAQKPAESQKPAEPKN